jgi:hypothetical protein
MSKTYTQDELNEMAKNMSQTEKEYLRDKLDTGEDSE